MTTNITTFTNTVLGRGHVMEDDNPIPTKFRDDGPSNPADDLVDNDTTNNSNDEGE